VIVEPVTDRRAIDGGGGEGACCVTVCTRPLTVTIPERLTVSVFACSVTVIVPLLLPLVGLTEIHDALSLTLQLEFELTETW